MLAFNKIIYRINFPQKILSYFPMEEEFPGISYHTPPKRVKMNHLCLRSKAKIYVKFKEGSGISSVTKSSGHSYNGVKKFLEKVDKKHAFDP